MQLPWTLKPRPAPPEDIVQDRLEESVRTMKGLHTVVCGIAITTAITSYASVMPFKGWLWILAIVITVIPFNHGALRHMDNAYVYRFPKDAKPKRAALPCDFAILFTEACILFFLSQQLDRNFDHFNRFVGAYVALLTVDIVWAAVVVHFLTEDFADIWAWPVINAVAIVIIALVLGATEQLIPQGNKVWWVLTIAVLRSAVDYVWNADFYFPMIKGDARGEKVGSASR
jgi:hypothetical protein